MPTLPAILIVAALAGAHTPPIPPSSDPAGATPGTEPEPAPALLLADFDHPPHVAVSWTTRAGEVVRIEGDRPYAGDANRTPLGRNVECFAAVGGTRLTKGAGHPDGAIVRVGFYKADATRLFFDDIAEDGRVRVELSSVRFNQPADASPASVIQHLKFAPEQLQVCSLPTDARDQFNTASTTDTINGRVEPGIDARLGVLDAGPRDQASPGNGSTAITTADDGSLTLVCEFPYTLLRHLQDPWQSGVPGTFVEPVHFHIEFEALPPETLRRIRDGLETWPPPDRDLDESAHDPAPAPGASNGDD